MKKYDVVVIGSGCGEIVVEAALNHGFKVAWVDQGPLGGTCLALGCIPSKTLIFNADRIVEAQESRKLGIETEIKSVDFAGIMERMRSNRSRDQLHMKQGIAETKNLDFYEGKASFTADYTLEVKGQSITGEKIFIAAGTRPLVPPIKGLDGVSYLTNASLLELKERPDSLIIVGGGYIAVEYGHFFAAMGTKVTMIEMADRLVLSEEPEVSELLRKKLSERMTVYVRSQVRELRADKGAITALLADNAGSTQEVSAQRIMMAVGRISNADMLKVDKSGIETDQRGFIKANDFLETSKKNIYAMGDIIGKYMFRHMANKEAVVAAHNGLHNARTKVDYSVVPHAIYSHPQVASVGLTELEARKTHKVSVGRASYMDIGKGEAMLETDGFAKAILDKNTGKILGFHIIGPYAPELIQEVVNAMTSNGHVAEIGNAIHIHPSVSELIPTTLGKVEA